MEMKKETVLLSNDELTILVKKHGIRSWNELTSYVRDLPYGRNKNRTDLKLVLIEKKGSCSSKHALLKKIATLNRIPNIKLILVMYKMNHHNTPNIGDLLIKSSIEYIPEAHCCLKINGEYIDFTTHKSAFDTIKDDLLCKIEIQPEQVFKFKVNYHKKFLRNWLTEAKTNLNFNQLWELRENCIKKLSKEL